MLRYPVVAGILAGLFGIPAHDTVGSTGTDLEEMHVTRSHSIILEAPADQAFLLFDPGRISEWAASWRPRFVTTEQNGEGRIFSVAGQPASRNSYWFVSLQDTDARRIEFVSVLASLHSRVIRIHVNPEGAGTSRAHVWMSIAGLTPEGSRYVEGVTDSWFRHWIDEWGHAINYSLRRGRLPAHELMPRWYTSLLGRDPDLLGQHPPRRMLSRSHDRPGSLMTRAPWTETDCGVK